MMGAIEHEVRVQPQCGSLVGMERCYGSGFHFHRVLHFLDGVNLQNSFDAVTLTESEELFVGQQQRQPSNKSGDLTCEIQSCFAGTEAEEKISNSINRKLMERLTSSLQPLNQLLCPTEASSKDEGLSEIEGHVDILCKVDTWCGRLGRAEERSEALTKETADLRTNLEQLRNEIAETQEQLRTDFPVEDVFVKDNDSMKSGYSPSLSDASSQTDSIVSHQELFDESNALIRRLCNVEICESSESDDLSSFICDDEEEDESCCSSSWYSDTSSMLEDLIEEDESLELNKEEEQCPGISQDENSKSESVWRPLSAAILSAYELSSPLGSWLEEEYNDGDSQELKPNEACLNSARSIYQVNKESRAPSISELHDCSVVDSPMSMQQSYQEISIASDPEEEEETSSRTETATIENERNSNLFCAKSGLDASLASSSSNSDQTVSSPSDWSAKHYPEVFEEDDLEDDGLVDVYLQEQKDSTAASKRSWFSFREKRLWPKFPQKPRNWFQKLFSKFRFLPRNRKSQRADVGRY